jgi:hypothetical protein
MLREAPRLMLAVDQVPVDTDVEDTPATLDELALNVKLILDRGRQTGSLGLIVSLHTVFNRDSHGMLRADLSNKRVSVLAKRSCRSPGRDAGRRSTCVHCVWGARYHRASRVLIRHVPHGRPRPAYAGSL